MASNSNTIVSKGKAGASTGNALIVSMSTPTAVALPHKRAIKDSHLAACALSIACQDCPCPVPCSVPGWNKYLGPRICANHTVLDLVPPSG